MDLTKKLLITDVVVCLIAFTVLAVFWSKLPSQVPLFYSKPWGQEQLASSFFLVLPPLLSIAFTILNISLARLVANVQFAQRVLLFGTVAVCLICAITVVRIVLLIT